MADSISPRICIVYKKNVLYKTLISHTKFKKKLDANDELTVSMR